MSMQGDPSAGIGGMPPTPDQIDKLLDGAADGSDTELPQEGDEAAGIAADGTGTVADEDAR